MRPRQLLSTPVPTFSRLNDNEAGRKVIEEAAKDLGKRWRFFPTYAALQTGTVLRHISSNA